MRKILLFLIIVLTMLIFSGCDGTTTGNNKAPEPPYAPTPNDNSANVGNVTTLSWNCLDPEADNLTYKVYIGKQIKNKKQVSSLVCSLQFYGL